MSKELTAEDKDWSIPDAGGIIDVPDHLQELFNNIGMQIKLHTISEKNEVLTVAHITQHAEQHAKEAVEKFARELIELLRNDTLLEYYTPKIKHLAKQHGVNL